MGIRFQSSKTRSTFKVPQSVSTDLFVVFEAPLGSVVSNHLSCQVGIMLGGLLASTGFILGSFATSLEHLYLTLGVLTGEYTFFLMPGHTLSRCCQAHKESRRREYIHFVRCIMQLT